MIGVMTLTRSTIGRKVIMALTGIIGILYVLGHMIGNLKVFLGEEDFNAYAEGLRTFGAPFFTHAEPLWIARIVLLVAVVLHVWAAYSLYLDSRQARSTSYVQHHKLRTTAASLYIRVGGVILLIFIIYHLAHFTWGIPGINPNFIRGEAYHNLVFGLRSYAYLPAILYLIAMVALGLHLYHGTWSLFQTLGLNNQTYTRSLRMLAWVVSIVVAGGFALVPLAVIFGIVR